MKFTSALVFLIVFSLLGCGGTATTPLGSTPTSTTPSTPAPTTSATIPVSGPTIVNVAAGQTVGSVDIALSAPQSSPTPNAQDLGVAALTGSGSAFNTGDIIHRGQSARVLLFGPGLSGDMQVVIRGPSDITISQIATITSTNNTPGLSFVAVVAPTAALGARTVVLQNAQGDVTTFTGGLEVAP